MDFDDEITLRFDLKLKLIDNKKHSNVFLIAWDLSNEFLKIYDTDYYLILSVVPKYFDKENMESIEQRKIVPLSDRTTVININPLYLNDDNEFYIIGAIVNKYIAEMYLKKYINKYSYDLYSEDYNNNLRPIPTYILCKKMITPGSFNILTVSTTKNDNVVNTKLFNVFNKLKKYIFLNCKIILATIWILFGFKINIKNKSTFLFESPFVIKNNKLIVNSYFNLKDNLTYLSLIFNPLLLILILLVSYLFNITSVILFIYIYIYTMLLILLTVFPFPTNKYINNFISKLIDGYYEYKLNKSKKHFINGSQIKGYLKYKALAKYTFHVFKNKLFNLIK